MKTKRKRAKKEAKRDAKHNAKAQAAVGAEVRRSPCNLSRSELMPETIGPESFTSNRVWVSRHTRSLLASHTSTRYENAFAAQTIVESGCRVGQTMLDNCEAKHIPPSSTCVTTAPI